MPKRTSTVRGRELGRGLRKAIADTGMTSREIAEVLDWDPAKLSDLVNGKGGSSERDLVLLLGVCRTPSEERDHLLSIYPDTTVRGWLQEHGPHAPTNLRTVTEHLQIAETLISWQTHVVPVLLRTFEYMHAVLSASSTAQAPELPDRVRAELAMQEALFARRANCVFYIHESALHLQVGGSEVHAAQLLHLAEITNRRRVTIRVVTQEIGAHAGLAGPFNFLTFKKYESLVWLDHENSTLFVEKRAAIAGYETIIRALDQVSLNADESKALITRLAREALRRAQPNGQDPEVQ